MKKHSRIILATTYVILIVASIITAEFFFIGAVLKLCEVINSEWINICAWLIAFAILLPITLGTRSFIKDYGGNDNGNEERARK